MPSRLFLRHCTRITRTLPRDLRSRGGPMRIMQRHHMKPWRAAASLAVCAFITHITTASTNQSPPRPARQDAGPCKITGLLEVDAGVNGRFGGASRPYRAAILVGTCNAFTCVVAREHMPRAIYRLSTASSSADDIRHRTVPSACHGRLGECIAAVPSAHRPEPDGTLHWHGASLSRPRRSSSPPKSH